MNQKRFQRHHRLIGIILLLPFLVWSLTGIFFLVRPGYAEAYERIPVHQYPLSGSPPVEIHPDWHEVRYFRSVLGDHLIVRSSGQWQHLHAEDAQPWPMPDKDDLIRWLEDAFSFNPERYGHVVKVEDNRAWTDTRVQILVDWETANITQNGADSRWIDRIYSLHYLEWTGLASIDRILGVSGLLLLVYMTYSGWMMAFRRPGATGHSQK